MQCSLWCDAHSKLPVGGLVTEEFCVCHTTSCIAQSNPPEDGQNCCPKHVELIRIFQQTIIVAFSLFPSLPSSLKRHGQTNIK